MPNKDPVQIANDALAYGGAAVMSGQLAIIVVQTMAAGLVQRGVFGEADIAEMFRSVRSQIHSYDTLPPPFRAQMTTNANVMEKNLLAAAAGLKKPANET